MTKIVNLKAFELSGEQVGCEVPVVPAAVVEPGDSSRTDVVIEQLRGCSDVSAAADVVTANALMSLVQRLNNRQ